MKYVISEIQLQKIIDSEYALEEMTEIVKIFVENYKWNFPNWVKNIEVKNPKKGDQPYVIVELNYPRMFQVDELVDSIWLKIYNATNISTSILLMK